MDIGKFKNNVEFYKGFEGEPEIEMKIAENPSLAIYVWDGYFCDLFSNPDIGKNEWRGFTKDYQEEIRTYDTEERKINISEYLTDLMIHKNRKFEIKETAKCLDLMCDFLNYAQENNYTVLVSWLA